MGEIGSPIVWGPDVARTMGALSGRSRDIRNSVWIKRKLIAHAERIIYVHILSWKAAPHLRHGGHGNQARQGTTGTRAFRIPFSVCFQPMCTLMGASQPPHLPAKRWESRLWEASGLRTGGWGLGTARLGVGIGMQLWLL